MLLKTQHIRDMHPLFPDNSDELGKLERKGHA